jgi:flagellar hook-associated protein 1 FlgK
MVGLNNALFTGVSGLLGAQARLATVGHNIANADTDGYSRQRVGMNTRTPTRFGLKGFIGGGTDFAYVRRSHDSFIELQSLRDRGERGYYAGRERSLALLERLYNDGSSATVGDAFDDFFNQARELSQDPGRSGSRRSFVSSAESIARVFRNLAADASTVQAGIDDTIRARVGRINMLGETIARANAQIVAVELNARMANDTRDQRDAAIRELSDLIDVKTMKQADGSITVDVANGYNLVQSDMNATIAVLPDAANQGYLSVEFVSINGDRVDITSRINQGELGGLLDVRDNVIGTAIDEINNLALTFVNEVNNIHAAGFGLDGVDGRPLFDPIAVPGLAASQVRVNAAIDADSDLVAAASVAAGLPGDNENILAMADLQDQVFVALGGQGLDRHYAELMHAVGATVSTNRRSAEFHQVRFDQTESLRESVEGVSMDDEMLDLMRFQKHFQANTKIIQAVSDLMDSVFRFVD